MADLQGRRIIVTGGGSGIGAGLVTSLSEQGAIVGSMDLDIAAGEKVAAAARARFFQCDVSDEQSVSAAFGAATTHLNGLDVLINAAGVAPGAPADATPLDMWDLCMRVNATGTFLTNLAAFPHLRERGGRVLNFASGAGIDPYPGKAAYAASKGAVLAWVRTLAVEWAPYGITVNAIAPLMWTSMYEKTRAALTPPQLEAHDKHMKSMIPLGRMGDVQKDLVPVLAFLSGDGSRFMTGQTIVIDGGVTMAR